ncbi:MAG: 3-dehydroquinate synthase [Nitrospinaceae bacterium]|jgi:3-dehydroquinate synthase|nr:3-dehydroquinate synthase [Nitrospinaceae bacterium]MBT3434660.1 3-dehydroquinate synthase [Nitrospinaceae bacterium]MBT4432598.1 3-dehydroquinate synthase [Nitrospinaceae bacterium]MBT5368287.1 3-dehydroquinate synthase [Nitrospinaceae bacterium]MBT5946045.1 3-dehydroquinate synthase [Nitrospinaceae bacterium]
MKNVRVNFGDRSYTITIGRGALNNLGSAAKKYFPGGRALVVTDKNVGPLLGERVLESLKQAGCDAALYAVPPGERSKSLVQLSKIFDRLAALKIERGCGVVALGGGVVGDLAGFAAATYLRGLPYIQVPTTLLAQVDSAVGGKTAVDHKAGKNLIGAFYQPAAVFAELGAFRSLPERHYRAGLAEVVKHAAIGDPRLFSFLEKNAARVLRREVAVMAHVVAVNCRLKARVVEADERESGLRETLNFGHTLGHAVELMAGYSDSLFHGEAVAIGMSAAVRLSLAAGRCREDDVERLIALIERFGLPTGMKKPPETRVLRAALARDKKTRKGLPKFVLMDKIGGVSTGQEVPASRWRAALALARR